MSRATIETILLKAADALDDATFNLGHGRFEACTNRSYYAVFYCLSALLEHKNIFAKTHQGAHNKFNEVYLKTGILSLELNTSLDIVFSLRQAADYDFQVDISETDAESALFHARLFLTATKDFFGRD